MSGDPEKSSRDSSALRVQYRDNRCYLATIANYYRVCCWAVWSVILATAWLLVDSSTRVTNGWAIAYCASCMLTRV